MSTTMADIFMTSRSASSKQEFGSVARVAADWLCLAATPTFAIMPVLAALGGGQSDILCSAAEHTSPLGGMFPMYVLMSAFHFAPWLKLISRRRDRARAAGLTHEAVAAIAEQRCSHGSRPPACDRRVKVAGCA
jgi:hypothetical protein